MWVGKFWEVDRFIRKLKEVENDKKSVGISVGN